MLALLVIFHLKLFKAPQFWSVFKFYDFNWKCVSPQVIIIFNYLSV